MIELTENIVSSWLPARPRDAHKGDFGRVLIVAGSVGFTGAPALAANAALRSGAGLIFVCVPKAVWPVEAAKLDEPMVFPLPCGRDGRLNARAIRPVLERLETCNACLVGPGLGRNRHILPLVRAVLTRARCPVVLDADGINALEGHIDVLGQAACPVILTPHDGEFARLGGDPAPEKREAETVGFSARYGVTLLRKGRHTLIAGGGEVYRNPTGNPGLATGGSGDVLAGILLALLGQGLPPVKAAAAAAWLHGRAADRYAAEHGEYSLAPTDVIAGLPGLFP